MSLATICWEITFYLLHSRSWARTTCVCCRAFPGPCRRYSKGVWKVTPEILSAVKCRNSKEKSFHVLFSLSHHLWGIINYLIFRNWCCVAKNVLGRFCLEFRASVCSVNFECHSSDTLYILSSVFSIFCCEEPYICRFTFWHTSSI